MVRRMSKLDIVAKILNSKFKPEVQNVLIEDNVDNRRQKFVVEYNIVSDRRTNYLLYRFDKDAFPFFKDISGLKKSSDYILFAENDEDFYVFVIELKKGNESANKQLKASEEFVRFIIASAVRIGEELNTDDKIAIRRIRICDKRIHRNGTKIKEEDFEYKDNFCDYKYKQLYLAPLMQY